MVNHRSLSLGPYELKVENLYIDRERNLLACRFEKTKADQFAVGVTSYVPITRDLIDPVQYLDVLEGKNPEDRLCPWKERPLLYRLRSRLAAIGVENTDNYSWHVPARRSLPRQQKWRGRLRHQKTWTMGQ